MIISLEYVTIMQIVSEQKRWELSFCAGYLVPPCKELQNQSPQTMVKGSSINLDSIPTEFFYPLFTESTDDFPIDVVFASESPNQYNEVRKLVRSIAFDKSDKKTLAARDLAYRLAQVSDRRSPSGLFVALSGHTKQLARVLLWKFPADESIVADVSAKGITIQLIERAFSRKSDYFKAAMFEGTKATTSFWKGKVKDNQAKQQIGAVSQFWIADFLSANHSLTDPGGTRILAKALKETIRQTKSMENKEALIDAANVIKSQTGRSISIRDFSDNYLADGVRQEYISRIRVPQVTDAIFKLDTETLNKELQYKSIVIDGLFTVRGPLDQFDDVVKINPTDQESIVEVSLRGTVTARLLR